MYAVIFTGKKRRKQSILKDIITVNSYPRDDNLYISVKRGDQISVLTFNKNECTVLVYS